MEKLVLASEPSGICIENVYGNKKSNALLLCIFKSLVMFFVCSGIVTGFCDAFSVEYDKTAVFAFTFAVCLITGMVFHKKNALYIGFPVYVGIFILFLRIFCIYVCNGLWVMWEDIQYVYADYLKIDYAKFSYDLYPEVEDKISVTITLFFIVSILIILLNITIVRYMNLAETAVISFIFLEVPLFIGCKPGLLSIILVMTGCICTGLLHYGFFDSILISWTKKTEFIKKIKSGNNTYTAVGNGLGVLMIIIFSFVFSIAVCMLSKSEYDKEMGVVIGGSPKDKLDEFISNVSQNGLDYAESGNISVDGEGSTDGELGQVSAVTHNLNTNLVVSFVPYSDKTVYLPGFKGIQYTGMKWESGVNTKDFPELGINTTDYIDSSVFDSIDRSIAGMTFKNYESVQAKMQISYVAPKSDVRVLPYITFPSGMGWPQEQFYTPDLDAEGDELKTYDFETREIAYYPMEFLKYKTAEDAYTDYGLYGFKKYLLKNKWMIPNTGSNIYFYEYIDDICLKVPDQLDEYLDQFVKDHEYFGLDENKLKEMDPRNNNIFEADYQYPLGLDSADGRGEIHYGIGDGDTNYNNDGSVTFNGTSGWFYIFDENEEKLYLADLNTGKIMEIYVDDDLNSWLDALLRTGNVIIVNPSDNNISYKSETGYNDTIFNSNNTGGLQIQGNYKTKIIYNGSGDQSTVNDSQDPSLFENNYDMRIYSSGPAVSIWDARENIKKEFEEAEENNEYRLKVCEAIKEMFENEYSYTLSPGKTPVSRDYVQYFLQDQKKGLCTHFASAAVMILRHLGIPARYREGYCIPSSLMKKSAQKLDYYGGWLWFQGDNEYNPNNDIYSVAVSDYYCHAWVEIYLDNKGFVPVEVTPHSYENVQYNPQMPDISKYTSKSKPTPALNNTADKTEEKTTSNSSPESKSNGDENSNETDSKDNETESSNNDIKKDLIVLKPVVLVSASLVLLILLAIILGLSKVRIRSAVYLFRGKFRPLIYMRYNELVKTLKKRKIVDDENPLPMEVCSRLSEYLSGISRSDNNTEAGENDEENGIKKYNEYQKIFQYIEKVLYSDYKTNAKEYNKITKAFWKRPLEV